MADMKKVYYDLIIINLYLTCMYSAGKNHVFNLSYVNNMALIQTNI